MLAPLVVYAALAMSVVPKVSLTKVLSTCVDAARLGCNEIRAVQQRRQAQEAIAVKMKDENDSRSALTEADLAAQEAIVTALRSAWPGINIIGEEDESAGSMTAPAGSSSAPQQPLRTDLCTAAGCAGDDAIFLPLDELTVFVDPLDGTREFVEGRIDAVQSLVGIAVGGRAVAGAIGLPFPTGSDEEPVVLYALAEGGASGTLGDVPSPPPAVPTPPQADRPVITTGDSSNALLAKAKSAALAGGGSTLTMGGAGNKLRAVAEGRADLAIMHFGTSLWDTAAPEALVKACGGRVTDLLGAPLVHAATPPSGNLLNGLGVVASRKGFGKLHDELCAKMRAEPAVLALLASSIRADGQPAPPSAPFAADVARTLDGGVVEVGWLDALLRGGGGGGEGGARLVGYEAPDESAFRGMMSDGCRLRLDWGNYGKASGGGRPIPPTLFYKRVVMGDLEATRQKARSAPKKLARDVKSYGVEAAFLGSRACAALAQSGVRVPVAFHVDQRPRADSPIDSKFAMLLSDFDPADGWRQEGALTTAQVRQTLATLARFHAFFWSGAGVWKDASAAAELESAVWAAGGYWQPSMQTEEQFTQLSDRYLEHLTGFGEAFMSTPALTHVSDVRSVGKRLQRVARDAAASAHPFDAEAAPSGPAEFARFRTIIHGDPKAANLFLRSAPPTGDGEAAPDLEVGLIDFQWTGFGLAATDVAHHLCAAAVAPECLSVDGSSECALLDHYHTALCEALVGAGAAATAAEAAAQMLTRAQLQSQYESALLDMGRIVFSYQWSRAKFDGVPNLNRNSYNKHAPNAAWLVARCDALLSARGV